MLLIILVMVVASLALAATEEDVQLNTGTGLLYGTMRIPEGSGPFPVVLIISGSGPTDRDGNSAMMPGKNNSLKQLAEGLSRQGVASLRYDKRAIGQSRNAGLSEKDLRFDHYIEDAVQWCQLLQKDDRFTAVTVAGHSEGAQIGANAAWLAGADGYVSLAGPGRPIFTILKEQLAKSLPMRNRVKADAVLEKLARGELVEEPPTELQILFRRSVQPYLISWQKYDPQVSIARFDGPVAIVQGTTDVQVSEEDAKLLAEAQPRARLVFLEGANHIFKPVEGTNLIQHQMSLADSTLTIVAELVAVVTDIAQKAETYHEAKKAALKRVTPRNHGLNLGPYPEKKTDAERVGSWARRYLAHGGDYLFGLAEGGYAQQGKLVDDQNFDCVSFMYRCTELARSDDASEALEWALRTRFCGGDLNAVVNRDGWVDYDNPAHLDFSLDMIRTGIWGTDISSTLTGATDDPWGSSRYDAGSFQFIPKSALQVEELQEGDIVWLVLDGEHEKGAAMREKYGLVIGHLGIVLVEEGRVYLAHAASRPFEGYYDQGGLVQVPLMVYLEQVGKFAGVVVTRL